MNNVQPSYDGKDAAQWVQLLASDQSSLRLEAAWALGQLGVQFIEAVPALIRALEDADVYVQRASVMALDRIGPLAKESLPALIKVLKGSDATLREKARKAVRSIIPESVATLIEAFDSDDEDCREEITEAIAGVGPAAVPELISVLKDDRVFVRQGAVRSLGLIGPAASSAVPALIEALLDACSHVSRCAAIALWRVDPLGVRSFIKSFAVEDGGRQRDYSRALVRLGADGVAVVHVLADALRDDDALVRSVVAKSLGEIGTAAESAAPSLRNLLTDTDP